MDDPLKLKIAASLDLPADTAADPEVARAIDADPEARAYARSLHTLDAALRRWPTRARDNAAWEALAARIDARIAELPSAAKTKKKKGVSREEPDPAAVPVFQDDAHPPTESNQAMSEPQDQDADLESLAALTRTSNVPPSVTIPVVRPALTDEVDDTSSGIVDIKKLAAMARSAESAAPPPPKEEAPKAEAKADEKKPAEKKPAAKTDDVMVAPSRAAAAVPKVDAPPPKSGNTWLGMFGGIALAAGAFALYNSTTRQAAEQAPSATASSAESPSPAAAPTPDPQPAPTQPVAPAPIAAPTPEAPTAQPAAAPPSAPPVAEERLAAAVPTASAPPPAAAPARELERATADSVSSPRNTVAAAPTVAAPTRAAAARGGMASPGGGAAGAAAPRDQGATARPAAPPAPPPEPAAARPTPAPTARPAQQAAPTAPTGAAARPASVDDMMNRITGGGAAPAPAAAAAPSAELPERPTRSQITGVLSGLNGPVRSCANGQTGTAPVAIVIGNDGAVRSANVSGQFAGTPVGECIAGVVRRAHFPAFRAQQVNITYPYVILPPR